MVHEKERVMAYLEGDDCQSDHAEPEHRRSIFAPQKTRIEEAHAWNHYPDEGCRSDDPSNIAKVENHGLAGFRVIPIDITSCEEVSNSGGKEKKKVVSHKHRK
jgi:hypothetical protein